MSDFNNGVNYSVLQMHVVPDGCKTFCWRCFCLFNVNTWTQERMLRKQTSTWLIFIVNACTVSLQLHSWWWFSIKSRYQQTNKFFVTRWLLQDGCTPLMQAATDNMIIMVQTLLDKGAAINAKNNVSTWEKIVNTLKVQFQSMMCILRALIVWVGCSQSIGKFRTSWRVVRWNGGRPGCHS